MCIRDRNKDGATEDGYPINKNQHHAQANIYEKNDANGPCLDMEELSHCSIMGLMMLAAAKGTTIDVKTSGNQAQEALHAIRELVGNKFGEE